MSSPVHKFLSVASLVSRIPVPLSGEPDYSAADFMMPLVGLGAAAAAAAGAGLGLLAFGPGLLAALLAMAAQYAAFNLFHLDGLLDTADASGVFGDVEKRRAVLKDPRIGSFALFAGFLCLAARAAAVSALLAAKGWAVWGALALAPVAGRFASMLVASATKPYGTGGLGSALRDLSPVNAALGYGVAALPAAFIFGAGYGLVGSVASVLAGGILATAVGMGVGAWYGKKMGGYSGDAFGAAVELGELAALLVAAAVFR